MTISELHTKIGEFIYDNPHTKNEEIVFIKNIFECWTDCELTVCSDIDTDFACGVDSSLAKYWTEIKLL